MGRAIAGPPPRVLIRVLLGMNERAMERDVRGEASEESGDEVIEALVGIWQAAIYGRPS